jgi:hypothetical protein
MVNLAQLQPVLEFDSSAATTLRQTPNERRFLPSNSAAFNFQNGGSVLWEDEACRPVARSRGSPSELVLWSCSFRGGPQKIGEAAAV